MNILTFLTEPKTHSNKSCIKGINFATVGIATVTATLSLVGCGGGGSDTPTTNTPIAADTEQFFTIDAPEIISSETELFQFGGPLGATCKPAVTAVRASKARQASACRLGTAAYLDSQTITFNIDYKAAGATDYLDGKMHSGLDIQGNPRGSRIGAVAAGRVVGINQAYGEVIIESTIGGKVFQTGYMHLSQIQVKKDDLVAVGKYLGNENRTGLSTTYGKHLHIEMRKADFGPSAYLSINPNSATWAFALDPVAYEPLISAAAENSGATSPQISNPSIPQIPSNLSPGSSNSSNPPVSASSTRLSWSATNGATSYNIGVRDLSSNELVVSASPTSANFDVALQSGKSYRWNLSACNVAGCSPYSSPMYFSTPAATVTAPTNANSVNWQALSPSNLQPGRAGVNTLVSSATTQLSWDPVYGADRYELAVRNLATNAIVVDQAVTVSNATVGLQPEVNYRWNVRACKGSTCSAWTEALYIRTPQALGVSNQSSIPDPTLYGIAIGCSSAGPLAGLEIYFSNTPPSGKKYETAITSPSQSGWVVCTLGNLGESHSRCTIGDLKQNLLGQPVNISFRARSDTSVGTTLSKQITIPNTCGSFGVDGNGRPPEWR
jgi:murein DD-endopeptidase MepM/ murein hydrolase activator NlpD